MTWIALLGELIFVEWLCDFAVERIFVEKNLYL